VADINSEQKKLYNLYALFAVSMLLAVIPHVAAALLCLVFFTWLLVAGYVVRSRAVEHDLVHNHATFIIRSLWIAALFSLITTILAAFYLLAEIDYSAFETCAESVVAISPERLEQMTMFELQTLVEPCLKPFIEGNKTVFINATLLAGLPALIYLAYRFFTGFMRMIKGHRLAKPKAWF